MPRRRRRRPEFKLRDTLSEEVIVMLKMVFAGRGHVRVGGGVSDLIVSPPSRVDIECKNRCVRSSDNQFRFATRKSDVAPDRGGYLAEDHLRPIILPPPHLAGRQPA